MAPYIDTITSETAYKQQLKNGRFFNQDEGVSAKDQQELDNFLRGPQSGFREQLEHSLVRTSGASLGQVWAAMNDVMVQGRQEAATYTTPDRPRRQSSRPSYAHPPSSSPASQDPRSSHPLSSPLSVSSEWAESQPVRDLPAEDYTVRLVTSVIRHILNYSQHQDSDMVLEVRQRERLRLDLPKLDKYIVYIDDGGLRRRICGQDRSSPENNFIALLEAKKRLNVSSDGKRFISDECLAQMVCEAIVAKANHESAFRDDKVVVIHAVQQFVCFLEFHITPKCIAEIMDGKFPSEPLKVTATDWFNLSDPKGRQGVYDNIRGLVASARRG
ncbi:hypothetical protein FAVG1_13115 [Fusarium avenaceum]|nr:hypothetical protein FAVG1_13115 [Fusarium avenaceum]